MSAIGRAAYNNRTQLYDERHGEKTRNYSRRSEDVLFSEIFVDPKANAPEWVTDRERLWNHAVAAEKRKDAQEALELILNLPHELTPEQRQRLLTDFVREDIVKGTGRIADVNIHRAPANGDERNIRAHVLMTVREIGPDGFGKKLEMFPLDHVREKWAERGAQHLREAGFEQEAERYRFGHLKLSEQRDAALKRGDLEWAQACDRDPTKHLGPKAHALEKKGYQTELGNQNRKIQEANAERSDIKRDLDQLHEEIHDERAKPANLNRVAQKIYDAYNGSNTAGYFSVRLAEEGIHLAQVTPQESDRSKAQADHAARLRLDKNPENDKLREELGKSIFPVYKPGEIVALTEWGHVYKLNQRTTGQEPHKVDAFLKGIDRSQLTGIEATKGSIDARKQDEASTRQERQNMQRDISNIMAPHGKTTGRIAKDLRWTAIRADRAVAHAEHDIKRAAGNLKRSVVSEATDVERVGERGARKALGAVSSLADSGLRLFSGLANAFESLFNPPSPEMSRDAKHVPQATRDDADEDHRRAIDAAAALEAEKRTEEHARKSRER